MKSAGKDRMAFFLFLFPTSTQTFCLFCLAASFFVDARAHLLTATARPWPGCPIIRREDQRIGATSKESGKKHWTTTPALPMREKMLGAATADLSVYFFLVYFAKRRRSAQIRLFVKEKKGKS
jgi:hypothetical protein